MKVLTLGGTSVSGKSFARCLAALRPDAAVVDLRRSDVEGTAQSLARIEEIQERLRHAISEHSPTHIINFLGSISNDFAADLRANVQIPQSLLHATAKAAPSASVVLIGSAAEYGSIEDSSRPVEETHPLCPTSAYGVTKAMQSYLIPFYAKHHKLNVKLARTFNILAPGLSSKLFVGRVYEQIAEIRKGSREVIEVGPLLDERDYISADLACRDYLRILLHGSAGEVYNVCSGDPISMERLLARILEQEGLLKVEVVRLSSIPRSGVPRIFGSRAKVDRLKSIE